MEQQPFLDLAWDLWEECLWHQLCCLTICMIFLAELNSIKVVMYIELYSFSDNSAGVVGQLV
jgi:hypothetical protein